MIVMLEHFSEADLFGLGWFNFAEAGKLGVYLFFFLSAFLLTRVIVIQGDRFWSSRGIAEYLVRRFLRIYPLMTFFLVMCLVTTFGSAALHGNAVGIPYPVDLQSFFSHLVLQDGKGVMWSIPVEFKYYFLLPFVAFALVQALRRSLRLALLSVVVGLLLVEFWLQTNESRSGWIALRYYVQIFLAGSAFGAIDALFAQRIEEYGARARATASAVFAVSAIAFIVSIPAIGSQLNVPYDVEAVETQYLVFALVWLGFIFGLRFGSPSLRWVFETKPLRYLGLISFSLYLWHEVAIWVLGRLDLGLDPAIGWIPAFLMSVALAHFSFLTLERPFLSLKASKVLDFVAARTGRLYARP